MTDPKKVQELGLLIGGKHWDNFLGEEKRHEYTNGFQHGYKHGYEDGYKDAVAERKQRTLEEPSPSPAADALKAFVKVRG